MILYSELLQRQYERFKNYLRDIREDRDPNAPRKLLESKLLDRLLIWMYSEAGHEENKSMLNEFKSAMEKLCDKLEELITRNNLYWKQIEEDEEEVLKFWPDSPKYVQLSPEDSQFAVEALQLLFLSCQPTNTPEFDGGINVPVSPIRMGVLCIPLFFVLDPEVSMNALRTFTLLLCYDSFSPALGFYQMVSEWIFAVPCGNGGSLKNDKVSLQDYVEGSADLGDLDSLIPQPPKGGYTIPISDHTTANDFRFRESFGDSSKRTFLVAQQAFSMAAFALTSDFNELSSVVANRAPKAIMSLVDLCLRPLPTSPHDCEIQNAMRALIVEGVTLMIPASSVNYDEVVRKYKLMTLVYAFKDPNIGEDYFSDLIDIFEWLIPLTSHQISTHIVDLSVDSKLALKFKWKAVNAVCRALNEIKDFGSISESTIVTMLKGLNQDLNAYYEFAEANFTSHPPPTPQNTLLDTEMNFRNLIDARVQSLIVCMEHSFDEFDSAVQQVPAMTSIYRGLTEARFVNAMSKKTGLGLSKIGSCYLLNDHARSELSDDDLRRVIFETAEAAIGQPRGAPVDILSNVTHIPPLLRAMSHISSFMDEKEYVPVHRSNGTVANPTLPETANYIVQKILMITVSKAEVLMKSSNSFNRDEANFEPIDDFRMALENGERGLEEIVIPAAIATLKMGAGATADSQFHQPYHLAYLLDFIAPFTRADYQLPLGIARDVIEAIGNSPLSDFSFLDARPQLIPIEAFHNLGEGKSDLAFIFASRVLFEKLRSHHADCPDFESYFKLNPNLKHLIARDLMACADGAKPSTSSKFHADLRKFMPLLSRTLARDVIVFLTEWSSNIVVSLKEEIDADRSHMEAHLNKSAAAITACRTALSEICAYARHTTKSAELMPSREIVLKFLRTSLSLSKTTEIAIVDDILKLGTFLPTENDNVPIKEYSNPIKDVLVELINIHGIKIVEMDSCSWLLNSYSAQEWFKYFTELGLLPVIIDKSLEAARYVISLAPNEFFEKDLAFCHNILMECSENICTKNNKNNENVDSSSVTYSHKCLKFFRTIVSQFSTGYGSKSFWAPLAPDIDREKCLEIVDKVSNYLFYEIVKGKWSDPYIFASVYHLISRNADERLSTNFFPSLMKIPDYDLEQLPWKNASAILDDYLKASTSDKLKFLVEAQKAVKIYAKHSDKPPTDAPLEELDSLKKVYLMVSTATKPHEALFDALCGMISTLTDNLPAFEDVKYNNFKTFIAAVCRQAVVSEKTAAKIILDDFSRDESRIPYRFKLFPDRTIGLNLTLLYPHLHSVLDGAITRVSDDDVKHPILIQWPLAMKWFKENLRTGKISQSKFDFFSSQMSNALDGVKSFISTLKDDRDFVLSAIIRDLMCKFFQSDNINVLSHICTILRDINDNSSHARTIIMEEHPNFVQESIKHAGRVLCNYNHGTFSEVSYVHDLAPLFQSISESSLDEGFTAEILLKVSESEKWVFNQVKQVLDSHVPHLLSTGSIIEAGCVITSCLFVIALSYQQETDLYRWAEVDGEDYMSRESQCNPQIMRIFNQIGIFESWLRAYTLFDARSSGQKLFGKQVLSLLVKIICSDSYKVIPVSLIRNKLSQVDFHNGIVYDNLDQSSSHPMLRRRSSNRSLSLEDASMDSDRSSNQGSSVIEESDEDSGYDNDSESDSDILDESAEEELRSRHRRRIDNSRGDVFRNSVLEDLESDTDMSQNSSDDSSDSASSDEDIIDEMEDDQEEPYRLEINLDDVEFGPDIDEHEDQDEEMNSGSSSDISESDNSENSYDSHDDNEEEESDSGSTDIEYFDHEVDLDELGQLDVILRSVNGTDGFPEDHGHHHDDDGAQEDNNDDNILEDEHEDVILSGHPFSEDEEGADADRPNVDFHCESMLDHDYWFWQELIQRRGFHVPLLDFVESYLITHYSQHAENGDFQKMGVSPELTYEYVIARKTGSDVRATFTPLLISTITRFMFTDIRGTEMRRIKSLCQWIIIDDNYRTLLLERLFNTLLEVSRGGTTPYKATFTEAEVTPESQLPESTTPSLVVANVLSLLTLLASDKPSDLLDAKFSSIGSIRAGIAYQVMLQFVKEAVKSYSHCFIDLICEPLIVENRKLLVAACNFVETILLSMERRRNKHDQPTEVKLKVKPAMLTKLVHILGSAQCNWDVFVKITNIIRRSVSYDDAIRSILRECRLTKSALVDSLPSLDSFDSENGTMMEKVKIIDSFMMDQVRLLRLISAMKSVQTNPVDVVSALEQSGIVPLWGELFSHFSDIKQLHQRLGRSSLQALLEIVASPAILVLEYREDEEVMKQKGGFVHNVEQLAGKYLSSNRVFVNELIRMRPNIIEGPLGQLAQKLNILDFHSKYTKLKSQLPEIRNNTAKVRLELNRDKILSDSFDGIMGLNHSLLRCPLNIQFVGEDGVDAGGVAREWLELISRELVDPKLSLFTTTATGSSVYQINPGSRVDQLEYFTFTGRILGRAVLDLRTIGTHFSRVIFKYILGLPISLNDMETVDDEYCRNLQWMLENNVTDIIYETFSVDIDKSGEKQTIDLIPDGRNIYVSEENKREYVDHIVAYRLVDSVEPQLKQIAKGFNEIVPVEYIRDFTDQEMELLISGVPDIDIDEWKRNTMYVGYTPTSPQIKWFWVVVKSFTKEERAKLLQFCTGTSRVPAQGFELLESSEGYGKFSIHKERSSADRLPSSHTCMNQLMLPQYESYKKLRSRLLHAITEGNVGFGFA